MPRDAIDRSESVGTAIDVVARMDTPLTINVLQKTPGSSARLKGLGVVLSIAIAGLAIFALTHALKNVNYDEVFADCRAHELPA